MADALVDELRQSLEERRPWFDGLQGALADRRWTTLAKQVGIDRSSYRTARVVTRDPAPDGVLAGQVRLPTVGGERAVMVEVLGPQMARPYVDLGLSPAGEVQAGSASCTGRLNRALRLLARDPLAVAVLESVLWVVHVLQPEAADYDVSYSDPEIPFSIFVGVPDVEVLHGDLRLAEGVLHECLHLQLSLVEDVMPLVTDRAERHFSPWQQTMRPAQGVLHGVYVFALLGDFHRRLAASGTYSTSEIAYMRKRVATCAGEVASATKTLVMGTSLTARGRELVDLLGTTSSASWGTPETRA